MSLVHLAHFAVLASNEQGKLPNYFREAGFANVKEMKRYMTVFGTLSLYAATRAKLDE